MPTDHDLRLRALLDAARSAGLERSMPPVRDRHGTRYRLRDREVTGFCGNDYLGYAAEPCPPTGPLPAGAGASRLVCGDDLAHHRAEESLARLADAEDAVLFPSGFQANTGALPALVQPDDRVFSDELNHASLVDGLRLSRGPRERLAHLQPPAAAAPSRPGLTWWVTESIFSMDGDGPRLDDLQAHLARGGALYLDEAHALGLYERGRGRAHALSLPPTALVGPLGKAFGYAGAFVAGSSTLCEWLRATARSFVYSTATPPISAVHIRARAEQLRGDDGERRRARLWSNVRRFAARFPAFAPREPSPIFPFLVGDNRRALALSHALLHRGWHVQAIRPPTVPPGTARVRVSISAAHSTAQIDGLADDLLRLLADPLRADPSDAPAPP